MRLAQWDASGIETQRFHLLQSQGSSLSTARLSARGIHSPKPCDDLSDDHLGPWIDSESKRRFLSSEPRETILADEIVFVCTEILSASVAGKLQEFDLAHQTGSNQSASSTVSFPTGRDLHSGNDQWRFARYLRLGRSDVCAFLVRWSCARSICWLGQHVIGRQESRPVVPWLRSEPQLSNHVSTENKAIRSSSSIVVPQLRGRKDPGSTWEERLCGISAQMERLWWCGQYGKGFWIERSVARCWTRILVGERRESWLSGSTGRIRRCDEEEETDKVEHEWSMRRYMESSVSHGESIDCFVRMCFQ